MINSMNTGMFIVSQHLEEFLAQRKCAANICRMKKRMNECHLALPVTHFREETNGQRDSVVWPKVRYSAPVRSGFSSRLRIHNLCGLRPYQAKKNFLPFQHGHCNPCLKPLQTSCPESTEGAGSGETGDWAQGSLGWSQGTATLEQMNQSPQSEGRANPELQDSVLQTPGPFCVSLWGHALVK